MDVIIPVHNGADLVVGALHSVFAQTRRVAAVFVVDDGSTDQLGRSVATFGDRVQIIRRSVRGGAATARNTGLRAATAPLVAFLDADDRWHPQKLERQLAFISEYQADIAFTGVIRDFGGELARRREVRPFPTTIGLEQVIWGCHVAPGSTMVARRAALLELGGYDTAMRRFEDWDLLLRAALAGQRLAYLADPLATINESAYPPRPVVQESLSVMRTKHARAVADLGPSLKSRFDAAMAFEEAVAAWAAKRRLDTLRGLCLSLLYSPRRHLALRIVLLPRLQRELIRATGSARRYVARRLTRTP